MTRTTIVAVRKAPEARPSTIQEIIEMIKDPNLHFLFDYCRIFALEMALIVQDMQHREASSTGTSFHLNEVKALGLLYKHLGTTVKLSSPALH
jgi:hypothetical protein